MEESIGMGYMLRSLDIPLKGPTDICGENLVMIIYNTNMNSDLKKKHVEISYNNLWYSAAAGIVKPIKVCTLINWYDMLRKSMSVVMLCSFSDPSYGSDLEEA